MSFPTSIQSVDSLQGSITYMCESSIFVGIQKNGQIVCDTLLESGTHTFSHNSLLFLSDQDVLQFVDTNAGSSPVSEPFTVQIQPQEGPVVEILGIDTKLGSITYTSREDLYVLLRQNGTTFDAPFYTGVGTNTITCPMTRMDGCGGILHDGDQIDIYNFIENEEVSNIFTIVEPVVESNDPVPEQNTKYVTFVDGARTYTIKLICSGTIRVEDVPPFQTSGVELSYKKGRFKVTH